MRFVNIVNFMKHKLIKLISVIVICAFALQGLAWGQSRPGQNELIVNSSEFIAWREIPKNDLSTMNHKLSTAFLRPRAAGERDNVRF